MVQRKSKLKAKNWKDLAETEREVDITFKAQEFEINKSTIGQFKFMENRRLLRPNHAKQIKRVILSGKNFDAPLIVNDSNGKRIIDGQHRITAIKEILETFPKFKIKVLLVVYKGLTKTQEKEIFERYNKGVRQSSDDFVQMFAQDLPILEMLKDAAVKVTIYRQPEKMHFKPLMDGYFRVLNNSVNVPALCVPPRPHVKVFNPGFPTGQFCHFSSLRPD